MKNTKAYILAGGKSRRFGNDKSIHNFNGKALIVHVIDILKTIFPEITIISNDSEKFKFTGLDVIPDIIPDLGPMGGIYTALEHSRTGRVFITACDMPFLSSRFIEYMLSISPEGFDAVIPCLNGMYEPLHGIYHQTALKIIKSGIDGGQYRISLSFEKMKIRCINEEEILLCGEKPEKIFNNINYSDDIKKL